MQALKPIRLITGRAFGTIIPQEWAESDRRNPRIGMRGYSTSHRTAAMQASGTRLAAISTGSNE